jgi:DNA-binding NtrC family response regulator
MSDAYETRELREGGGFGQITLPGVKLSVVDGNDRGRELAARRGAVRVGTAEDNDLVLRDDSVSRRHFELKLRGDEVRVLDLGSTNGTFIDGLRVIEAVLSPGALIRLGSTAIRVTPIEEPVTIPLSTRRQFGGLLGASTAMREVFAILERAAPTEATVLIEGETGCGKELAAEAIHAHSPRADGPFIAIDCGAIAPTLVESELFGHTKGAFTGAVANRTGVFEEADGGTLFLDEIGELPLELQPKLLRALETRQIRRVGATEARKVDVRIVVATNRDLAVEINKGRFREDLYFRIAVVKVRLPPLRARREDIGTLVEHFVRRLAPDAVLSPDVIAAFAARPWPGNVRELRNAVERAVAMASEKPSAPPGGGGDGRSTLDGEMSSLFPLPIKEAVERWTERFERAYLEDALARSGGSVSGAARLIGTNRRYVQRLCRRLGVKAAGEAED